MTDTILFNSVSKSSLNRAHRSWGVYRIATEIRKQGLSCRVISFYNSFDFEELDKILKSTIDENTKVVGFSSNFWDWIQPKDVEKTLAKANYIIDYVRNNYPKIKILSGGCSSTYFSKKNLKKVDAIFQGFAENSLIKYISALTDNKSLPLPTSYTIEEELSHGNIPVYSDLSTDVFDFSESQVLYQPEDILGPYDFPTIEIGRGCIFKCTFCNFLLNGKKKLDYIKNIENLREEFTRNYELFGIQNYLLSDDTFNDSTEKVVALHSLLTSLPFKVRFACYLRLDLLYAHPEQIPLLKEMGMMGVFFGIETFHKKAGSLVGKAMGGEKVKKFLDDLKRIHWGPEVKITVGFITGLPYETTESYEETISWIRDENNLVDSVNVEALNVPNPNKVAPGIWSSEFTKNAEKYGFYWPDDDSNYHGNWHNSIGPILNRNEATEWTMKIDKAAFESYRSYSVSFVLYKVWSMAQFVDEKLSVDELLALPRKELIEYFKHIHESTDAGNRYIETYKKLLLDSL